MARRMTGPDQETRLLVADRDRWRCVRCGRDLSDGSGNIQHRRARGMGGTHDPVVNAASNLIVLCGSGVTGCHGWVETHREEARRHGWAVPQWAHPESVPVTYRDGVYLLSDDGERIPYQIRKRTA